MVFKTTSGYLCHLFWVAFTRKHSGQTTGETSALPHKLTELEDCGTEDQEMQAKDTKAVVHLSPGKGEPGKGRGASHSTPSFCDAFITEVKMLRKPRFDVGEPRGLPAEGVTLEWPLPLRLG